MRREFPSSVVTVGVDGERAALVAAAVAAAGRGTLLAEVASVDAALGRAGPRGGEILLLAGASAADATRAAAALDGEALPRWGVVSFDPAEEAPGVWTVAEGGRDAKALAALLQRAAAHLAVRRDEARARGDLLTIARRVSHEMRSPLGCILTSADLLREELAAAAPGHGLVAPVLDSANELMHLVDRISVIARASAGGATAAEVEMGMVVWAARERLAVAASAAGAQIAEAAGWPVVFGVREWLERIWLCLIENALQHAGPRPRIELGWKRGPGGIECFVLDEGAGVPAEMRQTLFRPFHQLHEIGAGRGFGLSMVRRLVELQGGHCGYEPLLPRGSRFFFTLPAAGG